MTIKITNFYVDDGVSRVLTADLQAARVRPHLSLELLNIVCISVNRFFNDVILFALILISSVSSLSILILFNMEMSLSS